MAPVIVLEAATGASLANVRTAQINRDVVRACQNAKAWCVVTPLAPPRLWSMVAEGVAAAFEASLGDGRSGTPGVQRALGAGAQCLTRIQSVLVEPSLTLDAQLTAFVAAGEAAHLTVSSGMRIYRARKGEPKRLLANTQRAPGLSRGGMSVSTERLAPGDLFVLGSRDAFGMRSIGAVAVLLAQRPDAPVQEICETALTSCRSNGIGAGLVVIRARG